MRDQPDNKMASEPEIKGPDPEVWGHDADRPANAETIQGPQPQYHEETGEEIEVKGPDPKVWGDSAADQ